MTETQVKDEGGDVITMLDFGDFRSSKFGYSAEHIRMVNQKLPEFEFRDGDVLIVSYPKAGCTWMFEIVTMLLKGRPEGPADSKMHAMLEATAPENLTSLPSRRLLNTHLPYRRIPPDIHKKKVKVIFLTRNPKDVAVSLYNMMYGFKHYNYTGKFENWLPLYIRGDLAYDTFPRYYRDWEAVYLDRKLDMLLLYYEDLKQDTLAGVKKVASFLGLSLEDATLTSISDRCQFKEMKVRYTPAMLGMASYKSDLDVGFMRKGVVGDWKRWFTVAQSEAMDRALAEGMPGSTLRFTYQL